MQIEYVEGINSKQEILEQVIVSSAPTYADFVSSFIKIIHKKLKNVDWKTLLDSIFIHEDHEKLFTDNYQADVIINNDVLLGILDKVTIEKLVHLWETQNTMAITFGDLKTNMENIGGNAKINYVLDYINWKKISMKSSRLVKILDVLNGMKEDVSKFVNAFEDAVGEFRSACKEYNTALQDFIQKHHSGMNSANKIGPAIDLCQQNLKELLKPLDRMVICASFIEQYQEECLQIVIGRKDTFEFRPKAVEKLSWWRRILKKFN